MASGRKAYTPPKGRPTTPRGVDSTRGPRIPPTLQWVLVALAIVALVVVALVFTRSDDGTPHSGAPAPSPIAAARHVATTG